MNQYIEKLKSSSEFRNRMLVNFDEEPSFTNTNGLTEYTDSDQGISPNTFVDVKHAEVRHQVFTVVRVC
jgi:hypothetical protein